MLLQRILKTSDEPSMLLIRLLVGLVVFLPEGLQKFLYPELIVIMLVAILSTKMPILLGHPLLGFTLPALKRYGFWSMQHEARADLCMLLGSLYLLIRGGGGLSLDHRLQRRAPSARPHAPA
jgi:putative oxidoreductase